MGVRRQTSDVVSPPTGDWRTLLSKETSEKQGSHSEAGGSRWEGGCESGCRHWDSRFRGSSNAGLQVEAPVSGAARTWGHVGKRQTGLADSADVGLRERGESGVTCKPAEGNSPVCKEVRGFGCRAEF